MGDWADDQIAEADDQIAEAEIDAWITSLPDSTHCPSCKARTEEWWSYCAMCGHHIAAEA